MRPGGSRLAVQDAMNAHQRPELESYAGIDFLARHRRHAGEGGDCEGALTRSRPTSFALGQTQTSVQRHMLLITGSTCAGTHLNGAGGSVTVSACTRT